MSEQSEAATAEDARSIHVPIDPVDFEARMLALERRMDGYDARDQALLEAMEAVRRLTEVVGTLMQSTRPVIQPERPPPPGPPKPTPESDFAAALVPPVTPERLASAHERLRAALFSDSASATQAAPQPVPEAPAPQAPEPEPAPDTTVARDPAPPPAGRKSWLRRTIKRMVKEDAPAAGDVLLALPPAHTLAGLNDRPQVPWPRPTTARLLVAGRVRRRIGWERAGLDCSPRVMAELAKLVRLNASPAELYRAGVRLGPHLAFALVACSIRPGRTAGHSFTIAHADGPAPDAFLTLRNGARPSASIEPTPVEAIAIVRCVGTELLGVLAGEPYVSSSVDGDLHALELVQQWFAQATTR